MHHQASYGRPFPAKYKDYLADRGSTAGELGFYDKRQNNLFSIEDMYSGTNLFQSGLAQMGVISTVAYDGNIYMSYGLGTTDENGALLERETRWCVKSLVKLIEIVCEYAGI